MTARLLAALSRRARMAADVGLFLRLSKALGYLRRRQLRTERQP